MKKSLKNKILIGVPMIFITVMVIIMFIVSIILDRHNKRVANTLLKNALNITVYTISEKQEKLLFDSLKIATLSDMGGKIKYLTDNKLYFKYSIMRPTYMEIANGLYDIGTTAGVWKAAIYDINGELMAFAVIDKTKSTAGFIYDENTIESVTLKVNEELTDELWIKDNKLPANIGYKFAEAIPKKEEIHFKLIDDSLCLTTYVPIIGKAYSPATEKMESKQVGMVFVVQKLGFDFLTKVSELSGTDVNIFTPDGIIEGTYPEYKKFDFSVFETIEGYCGLNENKVIFNDFKSNKGEYFQAALPIYHESSCIAVLVCIYSKATARATTVQIVKLLSLVYLIGIVLIVPITIMMVVRGIITPIETIAVMARKIASGDFSKKLQIKGEYEVEQLASAFNTMMEDLQKSTTSIANLNREINERKKVEAALRKAEERYRMQFEGAMDAIFVADAETGVIIDCNTAATRLIEKDKPEIVGQHQSILHPSEKIDSQFTETFQEHLKEKKGQTLETQVITKKGEIKEVAIKASLIEIGGTKLMQGIFRDITERKKAERELQGAYTQLKQAQDQLIQAEKLNAVGQLASGVAHEVKNPLGIILQGIGYLERNVPKDKENVSEIIDAIKNNIRRADGIIRGLVDFSRATELTIGPKSINTILESSLTLLEHKLKLSEIKVIKELSPDLPAVLVDTIKIEQVFVNVILNAVQAMSEGGKLYIRTYKKKLDATGGKVGYRVEDSFKPGETAVVVEIEDTGPGISEENLKKIFDPFFTTKGPRGGAGLGLSITKNILDMHRGFIDVISHESKGTKFTIFLKLAEK